MTQRPEPRYPHARTRPQQACPGCAPALITPGASLAALPPLCGRCSTVGVVYLLHFDRRYVHAGHYIGWTTDLPARLAQHATGHGARLLQVVHEAGITWTLARIWPGGRTRERALKRQGGASRRCPLCGVDARTERRAAA